MCVCVCVRACVRACVVLGNMAYMDAMPDLMSETLSMGTLGKQAEYDRRRRRKYVHDVLTQLHSAVCLISGCLQPTQLSWLPVLSNVAPPSLCHKAATDIVLPDIEAHSNWPLRHSYAVERSRQPGFDLPHHKWSLMNRFWTGQGPCCANLHKWGLAQSPSCDCGQRQSTLLTHVH